MRFLIEQFCVCFYWHRTKKQFLNEEFLLLEPQADDKLFHGVGEQFFYSTFKGSDNL